MAELLYRIGRAAARRHWTFVGAWAAALALFGVTFALFSGTITSAISIPGIPTNVVTEQLADQYEGASGGNGNLVLRTTDGEAFTDDQEEQISALVEEVGTIDGVMAAMDPFETQQTFADQADEIEANQQKLDDGRQQLADAETQLDDGQAQLDAAREQAEADGTLAQAEALFDGQQAQIDAGRDQIETQQETLADGEAQLEAGQQVFDLSSSFRTVSDDGSTAVVTLTFDLPTNEVPVETKEAVEAAADDAGIDGVEVLVSNEISQAVPSIFGPSEVVGVLVAALVLVALLGTALGAALPLVSALIGVGVASLAAMSMSGLIEFNSVTPVLGVMLGLAVGIDYSLFILNRHRKQLKTGMDLHESIGLANGTSGNAVVFAGATVIVALLALNVTGIPFLGMMGTVGALAVAVAILVAITLTPAFLSLVGFRILRKKERRALDQATTEGRAADEAPVKPMSNLRAVVSLVLGIATLVVLALPALDMRLGLPDGSASPPDSSAYQAYQAQGEAFGEGYNSPLLVVADIPASIVEDDLVREQAKIGREIVDVGDVAAVVPIGLAEDRKSIAFQVVPESGPNDQATIDLVNDLRSLETKTTDDRDVTFGVAGNASANIDVSQKLSDALPIYLVLVVGLSLVILVVVFRSILVPLTATLGFVLSLLASFGGLTAIYQLGWFGDFFQVHEPGPIISFLPIIEVGILFGLAMDYQLFLVSGMREAYVHGASPKEAVQRGFRAGRAVVTAAAIIMISVFAGFIFSHDATIRPIGFGLAFGVLLDAFVVRMLLIPAAMHLLGKHAWWIPAWLDRRLPDVDVEGAKLERAHGHG